jgi:hypothetical protein
MAKPGTALYDSSRLPGTALSDTGIAVFDVARHWASTGPSLYYKAYGKWPAAWSEIVKAGIITAPLLNVHGKPISPDDDSFDFESDLHYVYKGEQMRPVIAISSSSMRAKSGVEFDTLERPDTYAERFGTPPHGWTAEENSTFVELAKQKHRYQQIAVFEAHVIGSTMYRQIHGRSPASWQELQESGLSPLAPGTINPLTGKRWAGDGSPNDILFRNDPAKNEWAFLITDEHGATPWKFG